MPRATGLGQDRRPDRHRPAWWNPTIVAARRSRVENSESRPDEPSRGQRIANWLALGLFVLMLVLFGKGPVPQVNEELVEVRCHSVVAAGWPSDYTYLSENGGGSGFDVLAGGDRLTPAMTAQLDADCQQRRTTYVGAMVLVALPTTLLAAYGLIGYRGRPTRDLSTRRNPPSPKS